VKLKDRECRDGCRTRRVDEARDKIEVTSRSELYEWGRRGL
jgi:hypothetical protein